VTIIGDACDGRQGDEVSHIPDLASPALKPARLDAWLEVGEVVVGEVAAEGGCGEFMT